MEFQQVVWAAGVVWECDDPDELTGAVVRREVELRLELNPGDLGHLRRKIMYPVAADAAAQTRRGLSTPM
jgi:hypothetical protein